jgi:hypothetical protein
LFDILSDGFTVGERVGQTTFVAGKGIRIENGSSYVRYQLPQPVANGEFSMEVEGLSPSSSSGKRPIFAMAQGSGSITGNSFEMFAQYRGSDGNPDNCIAFKAVLGGYKLEYDYGGRASAVISLDPATTYLWQGSWSGTSFRLVVKAGGANGSTIYDRTLTADAGSYAPNPHFAYIGSNGGDGSYPGMIVRNVWLSSRPRPAS